MDRISPEIKQLFRHEAIEPASSERLSGTPSALHEDVLTHLTRSAVNSVSDGLHLNLSDETSTSTATWIVRAAKSVPLFTPAGRGLRGITYGAAAVLYGASEMKWGDSAENMTKDMVLGGFKGVGLKGSMDWIGHRMHSAGLDKRIWSAPATGVAFGVSSAAIESGLSRSTYHDESGAYRGLGHGLVKTAGAVANVENLALGAATFTLGTAGMKALQVSPLKSVAPELINNRIFQNVATGFSFGTFSGMSEEAQRQVKEGGFSAWNVSKYDYGKIGKHGLFMATSDAAGAALGAKIGAPRATVENVRRLDVPAGETLGNHARLKQVVEAPLVKAVETLWDKNVRTLKSGVFHRTEPRWAHEGFGSPVHIGEYEPPYYQIKVVAKGNYRPVEYAKRAAHNENQAPSDKKLSAYIVLDDLALSRENQLIARRLGRIRSDYTVEIGVPVEPGTPARQLEQAMLELARQFKPQPLTWGYQTPIQFYRKTMNVERGVPTEEWMANATKSEEFKKSGQVYDHERQLIFASKELAEKYKAAPPPEPTWYRGPETFGQFSRGGWRQSYILAAVNLYSPSGIGIEAPNPKTARIPDRNFDLRDLMRPENAQYYLADKNRFFELFGSRAYDALADRHWLELRKMAFESVERHWPMASVEKDRATMLGTVLLARATEGHGHFPLEEAGLIQIFVPEYLWRDPSGRRLSPAEVVEKVNKIYDDMDVARKTPFDHTFGKQLIDRMTGADGDKATDSFQFRHDDARSLENILKNGWQMQIHPKYVPLIKEVLAKQQKEGLIPDRFEASRGEDGMMTYTPVYRPATAEERIIPLSELVKNLKIVDYGFKNKNGPVLGKVSLASHDVHDHARAFWLLEREGLFDGTAHHKGYEDLMGKLSDPTNTGIFKREGELVASVAYDWRNYFDLHPDYKPAVDLRDIRDYFLYADQQGVPLSKNQARALAYVEELLRVDPEGERPQSRKLRHILGGVWLETLEQKRKTESTLYRRADGTYQRMSPTNPEYLAFVIDAARILDNHGPELWYALNLNNLKMERYLRDVATSSDESSVPKFRFTPEDIKLPKGEEPGLPGPTRNWLMQHPGFNTRRAPIRNWLLGFQSEYDALEAVIAEWRRRDQESGEWRNLLYRYG